MKTVTLDVRADVIEGRHAFERIMSAVEGLEPGDRLRLIAPFQPVPLIGVMRGKGYGSELKPMDTGDWEVLFTPSSKTA
jgi:uncharacterized protein (DUF2249 family)